MAGNRTLKLSILADVDNLRKSLNNADNDIQGFGGKVDEWGKKLGVAFAAAGAAAAAYAGKLAIDGVKAAIEDEAAQTKLATTLRNVTDATTSQIKATEDYILKTSLAFGVTDDDLRPSLDRLVRSTKSVEEAQKLQTIALNVAAGTGKSLTQVSEALAKAHDGNFGALKRLGVTIDESIIKSKDFDAATKILASTFQDQASIQADTFDGKMRRLNVAFSEAKESVGSFILDAVTPLVEKFMDNLVPAFQSAQDFIRDNLLPIFKEVFEFIRNLFTPIIQGLKLAFDKVSDAFQNNRTELRPLLDLFKDVWNFAKDYLAPFVGGALKLAFSAFGTAIATVVNGIADIVDLAEKALNALKRLVEFLKNNPVTNFFKGAEFGGGMSVSGANISITPPIVPSAPTEVPSIPSAIANAPSLEMARERGAFQNVITINGAIDPISTARQIANVLGIEATTSGTFVNLGESFV